MKPKTYYRLDKLKKRKKNVEQDIQTTKKKTKTIPQPYYHMQNRK